MRYETLLRRLLFGLDPETAHELALGSLARLPQLSRWLRTAPAADPALRVEALGVSFPNPVGLAAGFDKNARAVPALASLGFGAIEVGGVTRAPLAGNPRPRITRRPEEEAIVNWMGLPNEGAAVIGRRLERLAREWGRDPRPASGTAASPERGRRARLSLNVAGERVEDYLEVLRRCAPWVDYATLNVSCPNVPAGRQLSDPGQIRALLQAVRETPELARVPALLKVSPDLSEPELASLVEIALEEGAAGMVATNTSAALAGGRGGLSGAPLRARATETIRRIRRQAGDRLSIIGVGGIFTAEDAWEKIRAGASLVQIYTGFIYRGPAIIADIQRGLLRRLAEHGYCSLAEAVGTGVPGEAAASKQKAVGSRQ
jgi:dihydroorotate dehydrogenase